MFSGNRVDYVFSQFKVSSVVTDFVCRLAMSDETIPALTDAGVEELKDMIRAARINTKTWHEFLDDFVDDADLVLRIKTKSLR